MATFKCKGWELESKEVHFQAERSYDELENRSG
jgi:hypothetical protein